MKEIKLISVFFLIFIAFFSCSSLALSNASDVQGIMDKAENGDPQSQFSLGLLYDVGLELKKDKKEAFGWYLKSANQGNAAAQNSLGSMYQAGDGVERDYAAAFSWYSKSAAQGYVEAYTNLAFMFDEGFGVQQDKSHAVTLYTVGAEKGSVRAMLDLAISYWQGEGTKKDLIQAYLWISLAQQEAQNMKNQQLKSNIAIVSKKVTAELTSEQVDKVMEIKDEWMEKHQTQ